MKYLLVFMIITVAYLGSQNVCYQRQLTNYSQKFDVMSVQMEYATFQLQALDTIVKKQWVILDKKDSIIFNNYEGN